MIKYLPNKHSLKGSAEDLVQLRPFFSTKKYPDKYFYYFLEKIYVLILIWIATANSHGKFPKISNTLFQNILS